HYQDHAQAILSGHVPDINQDNPSWKAANLLRVRLDEPAVQKPLRILVADDSRTIREILKDELTAMGYEVVAVRNGDEALGRLTRGQRFDLVITDWGMDYPGLQVTQQLFKRKQTRDIPIVMFTSMASNISPEQLRLSNVREVVDKYNQQGGVPKLLEFVRQILTPLESVESFVVEEWTTLAGRKPRLLIVDDDPFQRQIVRGFFERQGFEVLEAVDGEDGLDKATEDVDIVITDWNMPNLNGLEFSVQLSARHPQLPIIFRAAGGSQTVVPQEVMSFKGFFRKGMEERDRILSVALAALPESLRPQRGGAEIKPTPIQETTAAIGPSSRGSAVDDTDRRAQFATLGKNVAITGKKATRLAAQNAIDDEQGAAFYEQLLALSPDIVLAMNALTAQSREIRFSRRFGGPALTDGDVVWIDVTFLEVARRNGGVQEAIGVILAGSLQNELAHDAHRGDLSQEFVEEVKALQAEARYLRAHLQRDPNLRDKIIEVLLRVYRDLDNTIQDELLDRVMAIAENEAQARAFVIEHYLEYAQGILRGDLKNLAFSEQVPVLRLMERLARPKIVNRRAHDISQGVRSEQLDRFVDVEINLPDVRKGRGRFMAVMDGHRGNSAVNIAAANIQDIFEDAMIEERGNIDNALELTIARLDVLTKNEISGTTVSILYIPEEKDAAYTAILGDSPILIKNESEVLEDVDPGHVPTNDSEKVRIEAAGGSVINSVNGVVAVAVKAQDIRSGIQGIKVTRALGNKDLATIMSRKPSIKRIWLGEKSHAEVASDGLLGGRALLDRQDRVKEIARDVENGKGAQDLVRDASDRSDNIAALVWRYDDPWMRGAGRGKFAAMGKNVAITGKRAIVLAQANREERGSDTYEESRGNLWRLRRASGALSAAIQALQRQGREIVFSHGFGGIALTVGNVVYIDRDFIADQQAPLFISSNMLAAALINELEHDTNMGSSQEEFEEEVRGVRREAEFYWGYILNAGQHPSEIDPRQEIRQLLDRVYGLDNTVVDEMLTQVEDLSQISLLAAREFVAGHYLEHADAILGGQIADVAEGDAVWQAAERLKARLKVFAPVPIEVAPETVAERAPLPRIEMRRPKILLVNSRMMRIAGMTSVL
ncbi:MAG: response regulator, partial [Candidatus Omnitrophica bacterium]|nr:response regulator [Candidatus Omnitrophota bacterium]